MSQETNVPQQLSYAKTLNGIRTELASVVSTLDAYNKYLQDGAITPEMLFTTGDAELDLQLERLEQQKSKVDSIVEILNNLEPPQEDVGGFQ